MPKFEEHEFTHGEGGEKKTFFLAAGPKDGPLIIFIHGWPAIGLTWKHQIETFASLGFRAIAPDMPEIRRYGSATTGETPPLSGSPAHTANVVKDGGWFGGVEKPDPNWKKIPASAIVIDEEVYAELVAAMEKTGFWGADSWYSNHEANRKYFFEKAKNDGYIHMPTLFIQAKYDTICDTVNSRLAEPQRKYCTNLTEASIDAGHWVPQEKPAEVNGIIARWTVESCKQFWPGYWQRGFVKSKV
ncbi:hypothetical protein TI39_contig453g00031 [Zymoseptoria brevis]|uniref:AB hydrolase-1 domain-containing protein n=1 Tax=Zymoseptoria brevis TaxID=1047168 RepID=A0A0F4GL11_9PEZI|nr:hypothetical protein TI39_contig453g00031 [Zymoseptoria brevis]